MNGTDHGALESYELLEVGAGADAGSVWVSLGFSSTFEELDVLFIVGSGDDSGTEGPSELYFERYDQAYSGEGLADRVRVSAQGVRIRFNEQGIRTLKFPESVFFGARQGLAGYDHVVDNLAKLAKNAPALIEVENQG
ncbi:MAG: hypothetical protein GY719_24075 [bacterium]|nr:hypothetical protein [bacterium]